MPWFQVFFLDDVLEIGQLMGYFEKQAIPGINGYFAKGGGHFHVCIRGFACHVFGSEMSL